MKTTILAGTVAAVGLAAAANAQYSAVTNMSGTFMDISGTGTSLGANGSDDASFSFSAAHGNAILGAGTVHVNTNGSVNSQGFSEYSNTSLPWTNGANGYAVLWDDQELFSTANGAAEIYYQNMGDRTIVQWNNIYGYFDSPSTGTYQLQIFSSGPILAQFIYQDVDFGDESTNGGSATIGAVAADGLVEFSFDTASIQSGSVVSIIPAPGAAALLGLGGLIAARRRRA